MVKSQKLFSNQWLISQKNIHVPLPSIVGASVWLVQSRRHQHFLFGHLQIINIVKNLNEIHNDFLILFADRCASFRILPTGSEISEWGVENISKKEGLRLAKKPELLGFIELIRKNKKVSLKLQRGMPTKLVQSIKRESVNNFSRAAYGKILESNSLGDLKYSGGGKSPFGDILLQAVLQEFPESEILNKQVIRLDKNVIDILDGAEITKKASRTLFAKPRKVDVDLTTVEPEKIVARLFLSSLQDLPKNQMTLNKVQDAEQRHQDILKIIATDVLSLNLVPLQSSSIDLAVKTLKGLFLIEVKSATQKNLEAQVKKSFMQILEYKMAFNFNGHKNVFPVVVVEGVAENSPIKDYLTNFACYLNINLVWFQKDTIFSEFKNILISK